MHPVLCGCCVDKCVSAWAHACAWMPLVWLEQLVVGQQGTQRSLCCVGVVDKCVHIWAHACAWIHACP